MLSQLEFVQAAQQGSRIALEPYRAKRAIFLAAGKGERLSPITLKTPKPLVEVNGIRMIDRSIDACLRIGIKEIYVVRGYLKEEFNQLLEKYPMIHFIDNDNYDRMNNISSAIAAKEYFKNIFCNAYVLEADLVLNRPSLLQKYHYTSETLGRYVTNPVDWYFTIDDKRFVTNEYSAEDDRPKTKNGYHQMMGIYYFNEEDGKKLAHHLSTIQKDDPEWQSRYWETVPNQFYQGQYKIRVFSYDENDVLEIDTFAELCEIDPSYCSFTQKGGTKNE